MTRIFSHLGKRFINPAAYKCFEASPGDDRSDASPTHHVQTSGLLLFPPAFRRNKICWELNLNCNEVVEALPNVAQFLKNCYGNRSPRNNRNASAATLPLLSCSQKCGNREDIPESSKELPP